MKEAERNVIGCVSMHTHITCLLPPTWKQAKFKTIRPEYGKELEEGMIQICIGVCDTSKTCFISGFLY